MVACQAGQRQAMFYLVEQGADVNAQNMYGSTPLHELIKNKRENLAICKTLSFLFERTSFFSLLQCNCVEAVLLRGHRTGLIKHGADIYLEDKRTYSPFDLALPWFQKDMKKVRAHGCWCACGVIDHAICVRMYMCMLTLTGAV